MDPLTFLRVSPLLLLMASGATSVKVRILNEEPVHVIPGTDLLLCANLLLLPQEKISQITWERETETGPTPNTVTLATCSSGQCTGTRPNVLATMREKEVTLQIRGYTRSDGGLYGLSVTDQDGQLTRSAQCIVREYEAVHHVSVSINVTHSSLVCGEAWGTEPSYTWLYNRVSVSQRVGRVSQDGTILYITQNPICGRFTCMVSNRLGYATATYTADQCETTDHRGIIAAVVCLLLLLICGGLGLVFWRRHHHNTSRGQRLHEPLDDHI